MERDWFDFKALYGNIEGARSAFEKACETIYRRKYEEKEYVAQVLVKKGDGGIDIFIGELGVEPITVIQCKFFLETFGDSQKEQIRKSFKSAINAEEYELKKWMLCLPRAIDINENSWWFKWKNKQIKKSSKNKSFICLTDGNALIDLSKELGLYNDIFKIKDSVNIEEIRKIVENLSNSQSNDSELKKTIHEKDQEINKLEKTIRNLEKSSSNSLQHQAFNELQNQQYEEAGSLLVKNATQSIDNARQSWLDAANIFYYTNPTGAIEAYQNVLKIDSENIEAWNSLGLIHQRFFELESAKECFYNVKNKSKGDISAQAAADNNLGNTYLLSGDTVSAEKSYKSALSTFKKLNSKREMAGVYDHLGSVHRDRNNIDKAKAFHLRAIKILSELRLEDESGSPYGNLGNIYYDLGEIELAKTYHEKSLQIYERSNDPEGFSNQLLNLSKFHLENDEFEEAENLMLEAIAILEDVNAPLGVAKGKNNLGSLYLKQSLFDQADKLLLEALGLFITLGTGAKGYVSNTYGAVGHLFFQKKNYGEAKKYFLKAVDIGKYETTQFVRKSLAFSNCKLAELFIIESDNDKAESYYLDSLSLHIQLHNKKGSADLYHFLGMLYKDSGQIYKAIKHLSLAAKINEELDRKENLAFEFRDIGKLYFESRDLNEAKRQLTKSSEFFRKIDNKEALVDTYAELRNLYSFTGDYRRVKNNLIKSIQVCEEINNQVGLCNLYGQLGSTYQDMKQLQKAQKAFLKSIAFQGRKEDIANSFGNLGNIYKEDNLFFDARKNYLIALKCFRSLKMEVEIAREYDHLGGLYFMMSNFQKSDYYFNKSIYLNQNSNNQRGLAISFMNLGVLYSNFEKIEEAKTLLLRSFEIGREINDHQIMSGAQLNLKIINDA